MSQDWSVVGRSGDPAPGDPVGVRRLGDRLVHNADLVDRNVTRLRGIAAGGGNLGLEGDFAPPYLQALGELPSELEKLGRAYRACGDALRGYAGELETAKARAQQAYGSGSDAHWQVQSAVRQIRSQAPAEAQNLQYARVFMDHGQSEQLLGNITDAAVQSSVRQSVVRARSAEADRRRAAALADQAASLHTEAAERAGRRIDDALNGSGIKNLSWWEKAWNFVSAPFRSWDAFIQLVQVIAIVLTIVAMFVSGPFIGILLLVVGALLLVTAIVRYAQGRITLAELGLELLAVIPGGRLLGAATRLARSMRVVTRIVGPLRRGIGQIGRLAGGLRSALQRGSALFSRNPLCRFLGRDPVDMASGEMFLSQTDLTLAAASLPLVVRRTHTTSYRAGRLFGPAWSSPLDQRLEVDITGVYYSSSDGMLQRFPFPESDAPVLADAGERVELRALHDGTFTVTDPQTGQTLHFGEIAGAPTGMFNLVRTADRNGNAVEFDYAELGVLRTIRHYGGYVLDVVTDEGLVTALRLRGTAERPDEELVRYAYNPAGMLTEVVNSSGRPMTFGYDDQGRVVSWADRNGAWYRYTYDAAGRCVAAHGIDGILNGTIAYDEASRTTVETDSLGHATTYHVNESYQVERVVDALGHSRTLTWDRYNRLLSETDALGHTTVYTRDDAGNLIHVERADGSRVSVTFTPLNLPATIVGADGSTTRCEYDERGNLAAVTDASRNRTTFTVNDRGQLRSATDVAGRTVRYETNAAGLPTAVTDPAGATMAYAVDGLGRISSVTDPSGATTHVTWTVEGRPAAVTAPDGATQRWIYDAEGNLTEHVNEVGAITRWEYAGFDLPVVRVNPDGGRFAFAYDTEMRLVAVTNPLGLTWRYEYDAVGGLVAETDFNARTVRYTRDPSGRATSRVNAVGQEVRHRHDPLGRVVETIADGVPTLLRYDPSGRLVAATGPDADLRFEYDVAGRVVAETVNGRTLRSQYDALGRRTSRTTPTGARTEWSYDGAGRPMTLRAGGRDVHFGHDASGREVRRSVGSVAFTREWDTASRLASLTVTGAAGELLQHVAFTFRTDGAVSSVHDHRAGTRQFDLDILGRVLSVRGAGEWAEHYLYDAAGTVTQAVWPAADGSYTAAATGPRQYSGTRVTTAGRVRYEHDAQGRVTLRQRQGHSVAELSWRYAWDAQDRLVAVTTPDGTQWTYQYDPLGRRIGKKRLDSEGHAVEEVVFAWDGAQLAEQIVDGGASATAWEYEPGTFRPIGQTQRRASGGGYEEAFYAIVTDLVGTPTELIDVDGSMAWHQRRTLWGDGTGATTANTVDCPLRFPGQYGDAESELSYNVLRFYDPVSGRYASSDPIGLLGGDDPHAYVPNPLTWMDPLGLFSCRGVLDHGRDLLWGAANNMVTQAVNDMVWGSGFNISNLGSAAAGGAFGALFGKLPGHRGRTDLIGGFMTSVSTSTLLQGFGNGWGDINFLTAGVSGSFGAIAGSGGGHAIEWENAHGGASPRLTGMLASVVCGLMDGSGKLV